MACLIAHNKLHLTAHTRCDFRLEFKLKILQLISYT